MDNKTLRVQIIEHALTSWRHQSIAHFHLKKVIKQKAAATLDDVNVTCHAI